MSINDFSTLLKIIKPIRNTIIEKQNEYKIQKILMYPVPKTLFLKISIILVKGFNIIIHLNFSGTIEIGYTIGEAYI